MPLQGSFDVLDFSAVLEILASHNMTGRLHVRSRSFAANLFFADGQIVGADQSEHQAAAVAGDVTHRAAGDLFRIARHGQRQLRVPPGQAQRAVGRHRHDSCAALDDARQRLTEWQELQELIPSLDIQPRLVTELDPGQVTLDREQWRVLTAVDGRRNLRSIGRTLNMSDFEVCRAMRELLTAKVIEFDMRPAGMAAISEIDIPATEQVTINGKRATRLRPERAHARCAGERGRHERHRPDDPDLAQQTPERSEALELAEEPEAGEAKAGDVKAGDAKAGEAKAGEAKAGDTKAGEAKAGEAEPGSG